MTIWIRTGFFLRKIIKNDTGVRILLRHGIRRKMLKLVRFIIIYGYFRFSTLTSVHSENVSCFILSLRWSATQPIPNIRPTKLHYANSMSPHTMTLSLPDAVLIIFQPNIFTKTYTHWHWQGYLVKGWGANFTSYFALFVFLEIEVIINISFIWRAPPCDSRS